MHVHYGNRAIEFSHVVNPALKHAYITVDGRNGVVLKSPPLNEEEAKRLIIKKARWIVEKLEYVTPGDEADIVTGTRMPYLGRKYYTNVIAEVSPGQPGDSFRKGSYRLPALRGHGLLQTVLLNNDIRESNLVKPYPVEIRFTHSSFQVQVQSGLKEPQAAIHRAFDRFYREKAQEKITPVIKKWIAITGYRPSDVRLEKLEKQWGKCTGRDEIVIDYRAVKLSMSMIEYIVVHELCHLLEKRHNLRFWGEVEKYIRGSRDFEERLKELKL